MNELKFKKIRTCPDCRNTDLDYEWCLNCHKNIDTKSVEMISKEDLIKYFQEQIIKLEKQIEYFKQNKNNLIMTNRNHEYFDEETILIIIRQLNSKISYIKDYILEELK